MNLDAWAIPVLSGSSFIAWAWATRLSLRLIAANAAPPATFRIIALAVLTLVSLALTISALIYPSLIDSTTSRFFVAMARVVLFVGGVLAVRELRRSR